MSHCSAYGCRRNEARDVFVDQLIAKLDDRLGNVLLAHDVEPLLEDDLALVIHHVVVLQDLLADIEVALLDLFLGRFERLVHPGVRDRFAVFEAERLEHLVHALGSEDAHQVVIERQIELGTARVALTAGTAAQLIVDAAAFMALGREHVEAAGLERLFLVGGDVGDKLSALAADGRLVGRRSLCRFFGDPIAQAELGVAAQLNIGTAARHVGGDRHGSELAGLRDDARFLLVIACVQHLMRDRVALALGFGSRTWSASPPYPSDACAVLLPCRA